MSVDHTGWSLVFRDSCYATFQAIRFAAASELYLIYSSTEYRRSRSKVAPTLLLRLLLY